MGINYIVICREDQKDDGSPEDYTLATRTIFPTPEAAETFASGCASDRQAIVVGGRFGELRQDFDERFGSRTQTRFVGAGTEVIRSVSKATGHLTMETLTWPNSRMTRP